MGKDTITNIDALAAAYALASEAGMDELAAKLGHMHEMAVKTRSTAKNKASKTAAQNIASARELAEMVEVGARIDMTWIQTHVRYCTSPQKATAIMTTAIKKGWFVKDGHTDNHKVAYKRI